MKKNISSFFFMVLFTSPAFAKLDLEAIKSAGFTEGEAKKILLSEDYRIHPDQFLGDFEFLKLRLFDESMNAAHDPAKTEILNEIRRKIRNNIQEIKDFQIARDVAIGEVREFKKDKKISDARRENLSHQSHADLDFQEYTTVSSFVHGYYCFGKDDCRKKYQTGLDVRDPLKTAQNAEGYKHVLIKAEGTGAISKRRQLYESALQLIGEINSRLREKDCSPSESFHESSPKNHEPVPFSFLEGLKTKIPEGIFEKYFAKKPHLYNYLIKDVKDPAQPLGDVSEVVRWGNALRAQNELIATELYSDHGLSFQFQGDPDDEAFLSQYPSFRQYQDLKFNADARTSYGATIDLLENRLYDGVDQKPIKEFFAHNILKSLYRRNLTQLFSIPDVKKYFVGKEDLFGFLQDGNLKRGNRSHEESAKRIARQLETLFPSVVVMDFANEEDADMLNLLNISFGEGVLTTALDSSLAQSLVDADESFLTDMREVFAYKILEGIRKRRI